MAKFNLNLPAFKAAGKGMIDRAKGPMTTGALITVGAITAQKFLDIRTWMPKADPEAFYVKHQGGIKFGLGAVALATWKGAPTWAQWLIVGVMLQGAIQEMHVISNGTLPQIGNAADDEMQEAARALLEGKMEGITNEWNTQVAGPNDGDTGVGSMGFSFGSW